MKGRTGFALLETMLALALFATVATAMTVALDRLGDSTASLEREAMLLRTLESALAEAGGLVAVGQHLPMRSEAALNGLRIRTEVRPAGALSRRGQVLPGLYRVKVTGFRDGGGQRSLEIYALNIEEAYRQQP